MPSLRPTGIARDTVLDRLTEEFRGVFSRETIAAVFSENLGRFGDARVTSFVKQLALRRTRDRLRSTVRSTAVTERTQVLFICRDTSLGQLAAALVKERLGRSVDAFVAGPPADPTLSRTVDALSAGVDPRPSAISPVPLTLDLVDSATVIVTLQLGSACAVMRGRRYVDWGLAAVDASAPHELRQVFGEIHRHVERLLDRI